MLDVIYIGVRGAIKKYCFFYFRSKGGGGLGQFKKSLSENTQIFLTKGGGSHPIQKGFIRFFGIICQKNGGLILKKSLSEKTGIFFDYFAEKGVAELTLTSGGALAEHGHAVDANGVRYGWNSHSPGTYTCHPGTNDLRAVYT